MDGVWLSVRPQSMLCFEEKAQTVTELYSLGNQLAHVQSCLDRVAHPQTPVDEFNARDGAYRYSLAADSNYIRRQIAQTLENPTN